MIGKTAFLSGPISGVENYRKRFHDAEVQLKKAGYKVLNPSTMPQDMEWGLAMKECLNRLDTADVLVSLPGWRESAGAQIERLYAERLGKGVYNLADILHEGASDSRKKE